MRDTIDMAREAELIVNSPYLMPHDNVLQGIKAFEALVRADERNSWPAEMEAMERQVNILTDALAAEREACAKAVEQTEWSNWFQADAAAAIRARGNT